MGKFLSLPATSGSGASGVPPLSSSDIVRERTEGSFVVKSGLAQMSKGGLIMDVVNAEQAKIAEEAGVRGSTDVVPNHQRWYAK